MLLFINPQGARIYDAAFEGNTEAMRALGEMYHKGEVIRQDNNKALEWFMKAASMNDKFAEMDAKMLGLEMGIIGSLLNQDMLRSLRSMKPGGNKDFTMVGDVDRLTEYYGITVEEMLEITPEESVAINRQLIADAEQLPMEQRNQALGMMRESNPELFGQEDRSRRRLPSMIRCAEERWRLLILPRPERNVWRRWP